MKDLDRRPSSIRNLGPAADVFYGRAGIYTAQELHDLGPDKAYQQALLAGGKPHFIGYYAMVMGLQGRPWNDCRGKEKADLKQRFMNIKASISPVTSSANAIEETLDIIGTGKARMRCEKDSDNKNSN